MHFIPFLEELLPGNLGLGIFCWVALVIWLGATRRVGGLAVLLAITAVAFGVVAYGAFDMSFRKAPNRDAPLLMSFAFVMFSFGALICFAVATALGLSVRRALAKQESFDPLPDNNISG